MSSQITPAQVFQRLVDLVDGRSKTELVSVDLFYLLGGPKTPQLIDGWIETNPTNQNVEALSGVLVNFYLEQAMQKKLISPNRVLVQSISTAQTEEDVIPMVLALRNGAGANLYVELKGYGNIHLLGLLHLKLSNTKATGQISAPPQIVNLITLILVIMGANPKSPIFDQNSNKSISEWLLSEWSINSILPQLNNLQISRGDLLKIVKVDTMNRLAIYLDRPEWIQPFSTIPSNSLVSSSSSISPNSSILPDVYLKSDTQAVVSNNRKNYQMALYCRAGNVLDFLVESINGGDLPDDFFILSVYYLIPAHSIKLIRKGYRMTYLDVNRLMYQWRIFIEKNRIMAGTALESIILVAIQSGTPLDIEQVNLIPFDHQDNLQKTYSKPLWQKQCAGSAGSAVSGLQSGGSQALFTNSIDQVDLINLAISLGLDPNGSRDQLCTAIGQLSLADPNKLKEAVIKRQRTRIAVNASTPQEFIDSSTLSGLTCQNIDLLDQNPYQLIDFDVVSYRDGNNQVWCFTSNQFENLLRTGKNPYNNQTLPTSLINQIESQRRTVKRLGLPVDQPRSIEPDELIIPEKIGNSASQRILQDVDRMMALADIDLARIQNLDPSEYVRLSKLMGIETTLQDWEPLSQLHRRYLFSHLIWNQIKDRKVAPADLLRVVKLTI